MTVTAALAVHNLAEHEKRCAEKNGKCGQKAANDVYKNFNKMWLENMTGSLLSEGIKKVFEK